MSSQGQHRLHCPLNSRYSDLSWPSTCTWFLLQVSDFCILSDCCWVQQSDLVMIWRFISLHLLAMLWLTSAHGTESCQCWFLCTAVMGMCASLWFSCFRIFISLQCRAAFHFHFTLLHVRIFICNFIFDFYPTLYNVFFSNIWLVVKFFACLVSFVTMLLFIKT